ncbi:MgtC/SapB family protein [Methyloversatilis thermotolerans]|uniref:MgtC/SapB family protein n=1 Tax=Methyloversatilis thermotolerans TaxID=1346290 RepID=UPI00035CC41B|nr:MgtC/SapB family protein [Methyloversatilis thermotolerans]
MDAQDPHLIGLAAALGIGMLIGMERERRKGEGPGRAAAGLRSFSLAALLGALAMLLGGGLLLAVLAAAMALFGVASYRRTQNTDPGLTTEIALLITFLLGALAMRQTALATGLGVIVAIALAARSQVHRFVVNTLSAQEVHDGLLLAAAALVVLPLTPDRTIDPFDAINPRLLWTLAVVMMALTASGHIARRLVGPTRGLAFAGLVSGFVSSTATIAAMGEQARRDATLRPGAVAGAVMSLVATVLQLAVLLAVLSTEVLLEMAAPLLAAGIVSAAYGLIVAHHSLRVAGCGTAPPAGRAFNPWQALLFALTMGGILFLSAVMTHAFGTVGLGITAALAGFADAHSAAAGVANLQTSGHIDARHAALPILIGFSTNALSKTVVALSVGDRPYAARVVPGVALSVLAAWLAWWLFH